MSVKCLFRMQHIMCRDHKLGLWKHALKYPMGKIACDKARQIWKKMEIRNLFWKDVVVWPGRLVKLWRVTISVPACSLPCLISDDYLTNRFLSRFGEWWLWVVSLPMKVWGCSRQTFSRPSNCWPLNWVFGFLHFVCASCQLVTTLDVFFGSTLVVFIFV